MKNGTLPYEVNAQNKRIVDASDITRVYGNDIDPTRADPASKPSHALINHDAPADGHMLHRELEYLQEKLEREQQERTRLENELKEAHAVLKRTQDGHANAMRLIEDRTKKEVNLEDIQQTIDKRFARQKESFEATRDKIIEQAKEKLADERQKTKEAEEQSNSWILKAAKKLGWE